jgi:nitroreductase
METWETIRARRNVRQYTDQPIARADLERILDAGRRSASASNWQPWNFVVVTDRPQLVELRRSGRGRGTLPGPRQRSPSWSGNRRTLATKSC